MHTPDADPSGPATERHVDIESLAPALIEQAHDIVVLLDHEGVIHYVNPAILPSTGWTQAQILGRNILELVHLDDVERAMFDLSTYSSTGAVAGSSHYRIQMADDSWRVFDATAADISLDGRHHLALYGRRDESASPAVLYGLLRGNTTSEMLRPVCDVINWYLHGSRVGICWREDGAPQAVGTDLPASLSGGDADECTPWADAWSTATPQRADDASGLDHERRALADRLGLGAYWIEPVIDEDGHVCALVTLWMRAGGLVPEIHTLGMNMAKDYVELIIRWTRQQQLLADAALRDSLTGVANRKAFFDALQQCERGGAILYCDLDRFKAVNDELGHRAGDELLRAVARRIHASVRAKDVVGRLGGDEFAVLCAEVTPDQAHTLAGRICAAIAEPFKVGDATTSVGISIGLAHAADRIGEATLERADAALLRAKARGGHALEWEEGNR